MKILFGQLKFLATCQEADGGQPVLAKITGDF